jgi:hypothetical protein
MSKVQVDISLLKMLLDSETRKLVGKVCKRFEISEDKNAIKSAVKEILYEHGRDLIDFFEKGMVLFKNQDNVRSES